MFQTPWAVILTQHRPGETNFKGPPPEPLPLDRILASCDAALYRWHPDPIVQPDHAIMWLAARWIYHLNQDGRMLRLPGAGRGDGQDHAAFYNGTSREQLQQLYGENGLQVEDVLIEEPDELGRLLTPMLRAIAL